jgi:uncharacterized membrane protein
MSRVVIAAYKTMSDAAEALEDVLEDIESEDDVAVLVNDASGAYGTQLDEEDIEEADDDLDPGEGAAFGALAGVLTGLGATLGSIAIPGVGPVIAAGPLIAGLSGGTTGAVAGAATGGLVGGLTDIGISEEEAEQYAELLRRGAILVLVRAEETNVNAISMSLKGHNTIDVDRTVAEWADWDAFDDNAEPMDIDEVRRERETMTTT